MVTSARQLRYDEPTSVRAVVDPGDMPAPPRSLLRDHLAVTRRPSPDLATGRERVVDRVRVPAPCRSVTGAALPEPGSQDPGVDREEPDLLLGREGHEVATRCRVRLLTALPTEPARSRRGDLRGATRRSCPGPIAAVRSSAPDRVQRCPISPQVDGFTRWCPGRAAPAVLRCGPSHTSPSRVPDVTVATLLPSPEKRL